jgi:recombinational DNA repair ATPase RecF
LFDKGGVTLRLDQLWISEFKNLRNVLINFDEGHWVTVVIGWNGTGKSNVLEAIATLFRDLITGENGKKKTNLLFHTVLLTVADKIAFT